MPNIIEETGTKFLKEYLIRNGHDVRASDKKTFDLIVNGHYSEVKAKNKPFAQLDFISLTANQRQAIEVGLSFDIYLICQALSLNPEIYQFSADQLLNHEARLIMSYEYDRSILNKLEKKRLA